jgi:hypothetical protein
MFFSQGNLKDLSFYEFKVSGLSKSFFSMKNFTDLQVGQMTNDLVKVSPNKKLLLARKLGSFN